MSIKAGPKRWHTWGRQDRTEAKVAELYRWQVAHRKSLHGRLVNRVLGMGGRIELEK